MVEIRGPNIFPECKRCPVAGSQIIRLNNARTFDNIWVDCRVENGIIFKKVIMQSSASVSNTVRLNNVDIYFEVGVEENVTRECPGIKKRK